MHDVSLNRTVLDLSVDNKWMQLDDTFSVQPTNLSLYNLEPEDMVATQKDTISQVKAAFLYHVKNQQVRMRKFFERYTPLLHALHFRKRAMRYCLNCFLRHLKENMKLTAF